LEVFGKDVGGRDAAAKLPRADMIIPGLASMFYSQRSTK